MNPYRTADPVVDLAQARPMAVLDAPEQTVAEWSDANNYALTENYANAKLGADPDEYVVRCAYLSDLRSEPSKDYTFPVSRVALLDAHHADGGRRLYDRVAVEVLARLFGGVENVENVTEWAINDTAELSGFDADVIDEARELADVERRFGEDEGA